MGKATEAGLAEAATKALAPHFHDVDVTPKKAWYDTVCISHV